MPFLTADALPTGDFICRGLRIPNDVQYLEIVNGVLSELLKVHNFELFGDVTPQEMVDVFTPMFFEYLQEMPCMLGAIIPYATAMPPDATLPCDGSEHARIDFPRLYAAIDAAYIIDADTFKTPDLRGRAIIGVGTGTGLSVRAIGDTGGVEIHELTVSELPAHTHENTPHSHTDTGHTHGYTYPTVNLDLEGVGVPDVLGAGNPPLPFSTTVGFASISAEEIIIADAGENEPHENMPPFHALKYCIVWR